MAIAALFCLFALVLILVVYHSPPGAAARAAGGSTWWNPPDWPSLRSVLIAGTAWGCFIARKQGSGLTVCEQIRDAGGRTWPDPSSWYWPALTGGSPGPWWSTTIVEPL